MNVAVIVVVAVSVIATVTALVNGNAAVAVIDAVNEHGTSSGGADMVQTGYMGGKRAQADRSRNRPGIWVTPGHALEVEAPMDLRAEMMSRIAAMHEAHRD